ncbi:MAG: ATP-binding protein [Pseudomonadota bacterium]
MCTSTIGLWDWNIRTDAVFYAPCFKEMLGYTEDEFPDLFSTFIEALHPEDRNLVRRALDAHFSPQRTPYAIEYRLRTNTGKYRWFYTSGEAFRDQVGKPYRMIGAIIDITAGKQTKWELTECYEEIQKLNVKLKEAHDHLLQSERMTFIGQLATGVAHEINNPIGYVYSNLGTLEKYVQDVFRMIEDYESAEGAIADEGVRARLQAAREKLDIAFLKEDLRALMVESREGIVHVKNIVRDLKDFSHVDAADEWYAADLHKGLDSTLNIVHNEIKYKVKVVKEYGDIVAVECLPSQINQVFMNLLVNAVHAVEKCGTITVRTGKQDAEVWVEIADTGNGIAAADLKRIFDPFYTTKPIGQGTGLGLSLSYGIVQKHQGRMEAQSEVGKGSVFRVWLPIQQPQTESV